jgi:Ca2+/Na+ antiporter
MKAVGKKMNLKFSFHLTFFLGILLVVTGLLYLIKTFKYKRNDPDAIEEDDNLFDSQTRPSISTQTSTMGINNDNLSSAFTVEQEINKKH